jgi:hypothetical protein
MSNAFVKEFCKPLVSKIFVSVPVVLEKVIMCGSVSDPHRLDADPDPALKMNVDPDPGSTLKRTKKTS